MSDFNHNNIFNKDTNWIDITNYAVNDINAMRIIVNVNNRIMPKNYSIFDLEINIIIKVLKNNNEIDIIMSNMFHECYSGICSTIIKRSTIYLLLKISISNLYLNFLKNKNIRKIMVNEIYEVYQYLRVISSLKEGNM